MVSIAARSGDADQGSGLPGRLWTGVDVNAHAVIVLSLGFALSACANDRPGTAGFGVGPLGLNSAVMTESLPSDAMPKKTISDRVLAAIALERVTGRKPDPSRLLQ
jgi:hypothetical protein